MKYKYNIDKEYFEREDGLGKKFWINSSEAHRIMTMYSLGNSVGEIRNKIKFVNARRVTESTIVNFIKNVNDGNIILDKDYPAPVRMVESLTDSDRINNLEERVTELENKLNDKNESKVRKWLKF